MSRPGASVLERLRDLDAQAVARANDGPLDALIDFWIGRIKRDALARVALLLGLDALSSASYVLAGAPEARRRRLLHVGAAHGGLLGLLALRALVRSRPMILPFDWHRLSGSSRIEHRLDAATRMIYVRDAANRSRPSFASGDVLVRAEWMDGGNASDGWALRSEGESLEAVARMWATFGDLIQSNAATEGADPQLVMVQAMCEAAHSSSHPSGYNPRSSRTEPGYPDRQGENDTGDIDRDAIDWARSGGAHSSHGLAQALISTAATLVPELRSMDPRQHRGWLYEPANSWLVIARYIAKLPEADQLDPLRARAAYNAGGVYASQANAWGARMWSPAVVWTAVVYWNDASDYFSRAGTKGLGAVPRASEVAPAAEAFDAPLNLAAQAAPLVPTGALVPIVAERLRTLAADEPVALAPLMKAAAESVAAAMETAR